MTGRRRIVHLLVLVNLVAWCVAQAPVTQPPPDATLARLDAFVCAMALLAITLLVAGALDRARRNRRGG